jgi:hypothetical protein
VSSLHYLYYIVKPVECIQLAFRADAGRPKTTIDPDTKVQVVL